MTGEPGAAALKGDTRSFFEPGVIDALLEMMLALGGEISAVSEKVDTVIDLLVEQGAIHAADVERFSPDADQQSRRDAARQRLVQALLAPYQSQAEALVECATKGT